jgi:hypothetical protein
VGDRGGSTFPDDPIRRFDQAWRANAGWEGIKAAQGGEKSDGGTAGSRSLIDEIVRDTRI